MTTALDPKFLAGFLTCPILYTLVLFVQRARPIRLTPGSLAFEVQIDTVFRQTWNLGYATVAEVPLKLCDCGKIVRYAGRRYRVESLYGGTGVPCLKSLR